MTDWSAVSQNLPIAPRAFKNWACPLLRAVKPAVGFTLMNWRIDASDFVRIARRIDDGTIALVPRNRGRTNVAAQYHTKKNEMKVEPGVTLDPLGPHILIHEATHAICDMKTYKMKKTFSEAIAYIAGARYSLLNGKKSISTSTGVAAIQLVGAMKTAGTDVVPTNHTMFYRLCRNIVAAKQPDETPVYGIESLWVDMTHDG
ncbi:MAG: hypothetical protein AAFV49_01965 [Pseudomonadota bacterium]